MAQTGRTRHEAEAHDGETIRFLKDVPGHRQGEVATIANPRASQYVNDGVAELVNT